MQAQNRTQNLQKKMRFIYFTLLLNEREKRNLPPAEWVVQMPSFIATYFSCPGVESGQTKTVAHNPKIAAILPDMIHGQRHNAN